MIEKAYTMVYTMIDTTVGIILILLLVFLSIDLVITLIQIHICVIRSSDAYIAWRLKRIHKKYSTATKEKSVWKRLRKVRKEKERKMMKTVKEFLIEKENLELGKVKKEINIAVGALLLWLFLSACVFWLLKVISSGSLIFGAVTLCLILAVWLLLTFVESKDSQSIIKGLKEDNFTYEFETVNKVLKKDGKIPVVETKEGNLYELPESEEVAIGDKLLSATIKDKKRIYTIKGFDFTELDGTV